MTRNLYPLERSDRARLVDALEDEALARLDLAQRIATRARDNGIIPSKPGSAWLEDGIYLEIVRFVFGPASYAMDDLDAHLRGLPTGVRTVRRKGAA